MFFFFSLFFVIGCRRQWCNITATLVFTSLENRLPKAQNGNANVWINKRKKQKRCTNIRLIERKIVLYIYVFGDSRWSIDVSLSNFTICRQHSIIFCHMACLFYSSSLIDQTLSLPTSSTRQKYIDNDQLENLFLPTSCQSYCCCYLFVFLCIISSLIFFCYFHLIFCYISSHPCQQDSCFCWPFPSVEFDIILFDR